MVDLKHKYDLTVDTTCEKLGPALLAASCRNLVIVGIDDEYDLTVNRSTFGSPMSSILERHDRTSVST